LLLSLDDDLHRGSDLIKLPDAKAAMDADPTIEDDLPEIEWSPMARMRDRFAHHYWATDNEVVWTTAVESVPKLQKAITHALKRLK
jgi:uncharacterized protein with HEPN domain